MEKNKSKPGTNIEEFKVQKQQWQNDVAAAKGEVEFGEIGNSPAPILLSEGVITYPKTDAGYGLVHIEARHGDQIRKA